MSVSQRSISSREPSSGSSCSQPSINATSASNGSGRVRFTVRVLALRRRGWLDCHSVCRSPRNTSRERLSCVRSPTEVPEQCGVERHMQDLAWLLPVLDRPEDQRSVERFHLDQPTPRARADSVAAIWPPGSALGARQRPFVWCKTRSPYALIRG